MRVMRTIRAAAMASCLASCLAGVPCILSGCAATGGCCEDDGIPRANCLVCKKNGDLACVCVKITDATPRCELDGVTYYFCSEDCRRDFLKEPGRYIPQSK